MKGKGKRARDEGRMRVKGVAGGGARESDGRERGAGESEPKVVELERQHSGRVKGG